MKYIKTYEAITTHILYEFKIYQDKESKFFTVQTYLMNQFFNYEDEKEGFKEAKNWLKEQVDHLTNNNAFEYKDRESFGTLLYKIRIQDFTKDKDEPAYDVEFYWGDKFIGLDDTNFFGLSGIFSTKDGKNTAFNSAKNYIKEKLAKLPVNYEMLINFKKFDL